jgi:hypothetical protein
VSIWDHKVKKRLRQYTKYNSPIPAVAFNSDGTKLAVGVSYTWDEGEEGGKNAEKPAVFIKKLGDEVKVGGLWVFGIEERARLMWSILAERSTGELNGKVVVVVVRPRLNETLCASWARVRCVDPCGEDMRPHLAVSPAPPHLSLNLDVHPPSGRIQQHGDP